MRSGVSMLIGLLVFAVSCALSLTAHATAVMNLSDEAMVNQAETILTGRVTYIRSEWNEERTKIFSYVTVTPENLLKGNAYQNEIVVKQLGGEVGDIGMYVEGISVFEENEEVFVFLRKGRDGFHRVVGFSQGKFSVEIDPSTQRKTLVRKRIKFLRTQNGMIGKKVVDIISDKKILLDEFSTKIRTIMQQEIDSNVQY